MAHLEVLSRLPATSSEDPPLLGVHGAWAAAWVYENFLPYFAANGVGAYAMSLRGHGLSEGAARLRTTHFADYVEDVAQVARELPAPPVLMGHSLGGLVVYEYVARGYPAAGVVLLGSPPPSLGGWPPSMQILRHHPLQFLQSSAMFSMRPIASDFRIVNDIFFGRNCPEPLARKYWQQFGDESFLAYLETMLPFTSNMPLRRRPHVPMLVVGGRDDRAVPPVNVVRAAREHAADSLLIDGIGHNLMLEPRWERVAAAILNWLRDKAFAPRSRPDR